MLLVKQRCLHYTWENVFRVYVDEDTLNLKDLVFFLSCLYETRVFLNPSTLEWWYRTKHTIWRQMKNRVLPQDVAHGWWDKTKHTIWQQRKKQVLQRDAAPELPTVRSRYKSNRQMEIKTKKNQNRI